MRKREGYRLPMIGLGMLILVIMAGCAPSFRDIVRAMAPTVRANPQLQQKLASIKTVAVMPPGVMVYQLAVGGTRVMDEETAAARSTLATAIEQELGRDPGVVFTHLPAPSVGLDASRDPVAASLTAQLADTQALFEAVNASILLHTYKPRDGPDQTFPEKLKNFDYSLGPDVQQFAKLAHADALLFTSGVDYISSGGRKTLMVLVPLITGFLGGGYGNPVFLPTGPTIFSVTLVDATTGALLWYNVAGLQGCVHSLTDPQSVNDLTAQVLKDFPLGTRPTRVRPQDPTWRW